MKTIYSFYYFEKLQGDVKGTAHYKLTHKSGEETYLDSLIKSGTTAIIKRECAKYKHDCLNNYSFTIDNLISGESLKASFYYYPVNGSAGIYFFKRMSQRALLVFTGKGLQMFIYGLREPGGKDLRYWPYTPKRKPKRIVEDEKEPYKRFLRNDKEILHDMEQLVLDAVRL